MYNKEFNSLTEPFQIKVNSPQNKEFYKVGTDGFLKDLLISEHFDPFDLDPDNWP